MLVYFKQQQPPWPCVSYLYQFSLSKLNGFHGVSCANIRVLCYIQDIHIYRKQQQLLDPDKGNLKIQCVSFGGFLVEVEYNIHNSVF